MLCIICTVLTFSILVANGNCATVSGCPSYGCRPSGTFSYLIQIPSKEPKVIWNTTYEAIPNSLGCVGNINNVICPYKGPKSNGYVSIDSTTGKQAWYADVLHNPSLPVMDIEGDIIGTDGHNLAKYLADGTQVQPTKPLSPLLYPLFSVQIADNGILLFASMAGIIFTMDTAGIPHASLCFNGTVERFNGTFIPVTTPIIVGTRAFILTEFRPDDDTPESREPYILGMQRLYAIDIYLRMVDILHITWIYDFENEGAHDQKRNGKNILSDTTLRFKPKHQVQGDPLLMADVQEQIIYVILPAPEAYMGIGRLFFALKDGDNPKLLYKRTISASRMSMFEINGSEPPIPTKFLTERKLFGWNSFVGKTKRDKTVMGSKQLSDAIPVWLLAESRNLIYKMAPINGSIESTFNLSSIFGGNSEVTSDIMVYRDSDDHMDNILFGVTVQNGENQNYVVSLSSRGEIQWKVKTPSNVVVTGQIAGIASEGSNSDDVFVVFGNNPDGTASVFGIQ